MTDRVVEEVTINFVADGEHCSGMLRCPWEGQGLCTRFYTESGRSQPLAFDSKRQMYRRCQQCLALSK